MSHKRDKIQLKLAKPGGRQFRVQVLKGKKKKKESLKAIEKQRPSQRCSRGRATRPWGEPEFKEHGGERGGLRDDRGGVA